MFRAMVKGGTLGFMGGGSVALIAPYFFYAANYSQGTDLYYPFQIMSCGFGLLSGIALGAKNQQNREEKAERDPDEPRPEEAIELLSEISVDSPNHLNEKAVGPVAEDDEKILSFSNRISAALQSSEEKNGSPAVERAYFESRPRVINKEFRCPLSGQVMTDPVIAHDGQTYDRKSIQERLQRGLSPIPLTALIANVALKARIDSYQLYANQLAERRDQSDSESESIPQGPLSSPQALSVKRS